MTKTSTLIFHNLKKAKGQYISLGIIICLVACIMNIALVLAFQTFAAYETRFEELCTADVNVLVPEFFDNDSLLDELKKADGVAAAERHEGIFVTATVREFAGSDFDMNTVFYNLDEARTLNRLELLADGGQGRDCVYIPVYMKALGGFLEGGAITYAVDGKEYTYKVSGTVTEMQYGNYGTGLIGGYFPKAAYEEFANNHKSSVVAEYSIKKAEGAKAEQVKKAVADMLKEKGVATVSINDRDAAKQTRTMVCVLLIVIFLAIAAILLAVSIFLSNFRVRSTIEDELAQMGVLKAVGYTSGMIITAAVVPYTLVGALFALVGAALSYAVLPSVAGILAIQSGFSYTPVFDGTALLLVVLVPTAALLFFCCIAAGKIRRLAPINAIRGITGNGNAGQNVLLFAVSFGIMVLLAFAGTLLYNVSIKPDNFMNTLSEETPSVIFAAQDGRLTELKEVLQGDDRVTLALEYASVPVSYGDGSLTAFVCEDFSRVTNDICYEGKSPSGENEIAVGSALAERYPQGSSIELTVGEKTAGYTVTGFVQSVNNAGAVCQLTGAGYRRIGENAGTVNVYLKDGGAADVIAEYEESHGELVMSSVNYEQLSANGRKLYAGIVSVVAVVLFAISVLMVLLVLYVIIGGMISRRRQEFGIYKAIGYTSRQLTLKLACSFLPVVAAASALSAIAGVWYLPAINRTVFGLVGAVKNQFEVSVWFVLAFAAAFTGAAFIISVLLAAPIKKITVYSLLKD